MVALRLRSIPGELELARAGGAFKKCTCCGRVFTLAQWHALPILGHIDTVEMRNCPTCDGTMGIERDEVPPCP